ncbi:hypothetical protein BKA69DRAFT_1061805 [Paraphysoderma sedebokerense]|nr:hypothetical protein BKA69DRAFT_1061805 [Paraphysoderma sedebokerense]
MPRAYTTKRSKKVAVTEDGSGRAIKKITKTITVEETRIQQHIAETPALTSSQGDDSALVDELVAAAATSADFDDVPFEDARDDEDVMVEIQGMRRERSRSRSVEISGPSDAAVSSEPGREDRSAPSAPPSSEGEQTAELNPGKQPPVEQPMEEVEGPQVVEPPEVPTSAQGQPESRTSKEQDMAEVEAPQISEPPDVPVSHPAQFESRPPMEQSMEEVEEPQVVEPPEIPPEHFEDEGPVEFSGESPIIEEADQPQSQQQDEPEMERNQGRQKTPQPTTGPSETYPTPARTPTKRRSKGKESVYAQGKAAEGVTQTTKKTVKKTSMKRGRKRGKRTYVSWGRYVYRVLKEIHPDLGISNKGMQVMNSFISDLFERFAVESKNLVSSTHHKTISARDVQYATRMLLPGELAKHGVSEGNKAVVRFNSQK